MDQTSVSEPVNAHHAIDPKLIALAKKQRVTFVKEPIKPFSIMFEDACPLDLSITKYCFQGCEFAFRGDQKAWVRCNGRIACKRFDEIDFKNDDVEFLSIDDSGKNCWVRAERFSINPLNGRNWIKINMRGGRSVVVTEDHDCQVFRPNSVVNMPASKIRPGDVFGFCHGIENSDDDSCIPEIFGDRIDTAFFAGCLLADGCLTAHGVRSLWADLYLNHTTKRWIGEKALHLGARIVKAANEGTWHLQLPGRKKWQEWLGTATAHHKKVPDSIFTASSKIRHAFLAGLFNCDGHLSIKRKSWSFFSTSIELVDAVQFLLSMDGIVSTRMIQKARKHSSECYHVTVTHEDCAKLLTLLDNRHVIDDWSIFQNSNVRKVPVGLCHGSWADFWQKRESCSYTNQNDHKCSPGEIPERYRNTDLWFVAVESVENIPADPDELGYCPVNTPHKRIVLSDMTLFSQCFANLNRKAANSMRGEIEDPTDKVIKLIQKSNGPGFDPTRFMEWCIRSNYPFCFSNNVDPFMPASEEQYKCGERILRTCDEFGQRLVIQTKEVFYNDNIRDLIIANRENFQMYVSISTIDFEQSQKYETVLVPPMERLRRIEILAKAGVHVCVGLNPYVPEWIPNARAYCKALADHGVKGIFTSPLHFSRKQKTVVDKKRMGNYVEMANRYDQHEEDMETVWRAMCNFFGLQLYYPTMQKRNMDFHHGITAFPMDETWPMQRGWIMCEIRKLYDEVKRPIEIRWKDFSDFYDEQDEWSNPFKVDDIGMVVCHVTEQHKAFRSSLGKLNILLIYQS